MERGKQVKRRIGLIVGSASFFCISCLAYAVGPKVDNGSMVHLSYYFEANGVPVVSQQKKEEMKLVVGRGIYPQDFEKQLVGLKVGDVRNITLTPDQAYGPYLPQLVKRIAKQDLPPTLPLKEGLLLAGKNSRRPIRIAKVLEDSVVLDENHPLAGKTLAYHVQVTDIR